MSRAPQDRSPLAGAAERLWELSSDLMAVADTTGRVLAMNSAWTAALGWTEAEVRGQGKAQIVHPDDLGAVEQIPWVIG